MQRAHLEPHSSQWSQDFGGSRAACVKNKASFNGTRGESGQFFGNISNFIVRGCYEYDLTRRQESQIINPES
jgi:hypothetical protein